MNNIDIGNEFRKPRNIIIIAIICTALWGSAFPAIKIGYNLFNIAGNDISTKLLFAGIRFILAGLMVAIYYCISNKRLALPGKESIRGIAVLGLVQTTLQYVFFYISLVYLSGVKGSILNSIGNFFAVILAHFFFSNDKLNLQKILGCLLGFGGVVLCNIESGSMDLSFNIMGEGFILIAAFCFAMGSVITKFVTRKNNSVMVTGYQLMLGGMVLAILGLVMGGTLSFNSIGANMLLIYLAVLSAVAFSLWAQLLKYNSVGKISIYCFLNPVFGVILSGVFLGEEFLNIECFGALLLVSLGIYIVNKKSE